MLASAVLTIAAAIESARTPDPEQIPLTRNEIAHLLVSVAPSAQCTVPGTE
jgi:hypothetical protein